MKVWKVQEFERTPKQLEEILNDIQTFGGTIKSVSASPVKDDPRHWGCYEGIIVYTEEDVEE